MSQLTPSQLQQVGFQLAPRPPHGCDHHGEVYVRQLPQGPAYVLCTNHSEAVEVFVGDWLKPLVYYYWVTPDIQKLTNLLGLAV